MKLRGSSFLIWVACCTFVTVGGATYLSWDGSGTIRVLTTIAAFAVGLIAAFGIPALAAWVDAPSPPEQRQPATKPEPPPARRSVDDEQLRAQLAIGTGLRARLQQAISAGTPNGTEQLLPQVDSWIDETRALLADGAPDLAEYFAADKPDTAQTNWPAKLQDAINISHAGRLDRHLERLTEILSSRS
jgi:hypothetical protein